MKVYEEMRLFDFTFWGGAYYHAREIAEEDFDRIEEILEELFPDGISDTKINDIFWFEEDFLAECLGYNSWEQFLEDRVNIAFYNDFDL